ncbi:hypothetical protein PR048_012858 [Dryococelus australis]|uniref:RNA-directed DNA polymerase n=1 Tax=Dryococelus australis TaxID=614101 RepID=A0ABQ9HQP3_9NEOP|nr:hypothetical protein PR048_012858 [Dryococelus australis]
MREHCRLPTWEEVTLKMNGVQYFSTLNANKMFWQICLTADSSKLTTFVKEDSDSHGCHKGSRVHLKYSTESLAHCFRTLKGFFGKDEIEHDKRLERVLQRATENNVTFNLDKCSISGTSLARRGSRVIQVKFMPSQNFQSQRTLWTQQHTIAFEHLKTLLTTTPVLQYYDPHDTVTRSVDTSQKGLGALLSQSQGPVAYASKSLSPAQQNYTQIEKELLAFVYGCERFHQYIYGRKVFVESDHNPLEAILSKPLDRCPLRLQRMRIKLQNYDSTLRYVPGKELVISDALSRPSGPDTEFELQEQEIAAQQGLQHSLQSHGNPEKKLQAQECVFWPGMSKEIQDIVDNCITCRAAQNLNSREPQINKEIPDRPWQIAAANIFHFQGKDYLFMVDAYSKYPEFSHLSNLSSTQFVTHCKTIMARYGIPETLYSDNGPQFSSREFKEFARLGDINHKSSSPGYPQSNGLAEHHVQSIKQMLKKAVEDRKDIMLAFLEYRNTPIYNTLQSPEQLLFSRRLRGLLSCTANRLMPQAQPTIKRDLKIR